MIFWSIWSVVVVFFLVVSILHLRQCRILDKMAKESQDKDQRQQHLQIVEDSFWDSWIENEARKVEFMFGEKQVDFYIVEAPRQYILFHHLAKYKDKQSISDAVFKRFEDLKDGGGRNLILS